MIENNGLIKNTFIMLESNKILHFTDIYSNNLIFNSLSFGFIVE